MPCGTLHIPYSWCEMFHWKYRIGKSNWKNFVRKFRSPTVSKITIFLKAIFSCPNSDLPARLPALLNESHGRHAFSIRNERLLTSNPRNCRRFRIRMLPRAPARFTPMDQITFFPVFLILGRPLLPELDEAAHAFQSGTFAIGETGGFFRRGGGWAFRGDFGVVSGMPRFFSWKWRFRVVSSFSDFVSDPPAEMLFSRFAMFCSMSTSICWSSSRTS